MIRIVLLALVLLASHAWAISDPSEALRDPAQEARAVAIGKQLRCLVCQNESIEDSGADLAHDLRNIVRQPVMAGETEEQITAWMVQRYGDFVRLKPPFKLTTLLLWGSPLVALLIGGLTVLGLRRSSTPAPAPLSEAERRRLSSLMEP